jgi:hypothetical protein
MKDFTKQSLKTDLWFLFPDKVLGCPGPLDMMAPRLRPVRTLVLEEPVCTGIITTGPVLSYGLREWPGIS